MAQNQRDRVVAYIDTVVAYYVRHKFRCDVTDQDEFAKIVETIKMNILEEALPQISEKKLSEARQKVEEEARQYKKQLLQKVRISLIVETIFIAFLVGIVVNQVTNLIPKQHWWLAIVISLGLCVFMVILATVEPKE